MKLVNDMFDRSLEKTWIFGFERTGKEYDMAKYNVDIDLANETKREMAKVINSNDDRVLNKLGAFASLFDVSTENYSEPVLVLKTEEPGSKQLLAAKYDRIEGVCYDMINHLINDCIVMGATPLTVQDAIICGKINKGVVTRIVNAVSEACIENECILTGGETSEQPGVLDDDTFILTSSIVGIVDKKNIIDGSKIQEGDVVVSLQSSGIHTNGYTLVRTIMEENPDVINEKIGNKGFIETILTPHRCYYSALKDLFETRKIKGLAHITGGGIKENLNRILPPSLDAKILLDSYVVPQIFSILKKYGNVDDEEMVRTFNLGVGMALVTSSECVNEIIEHIENKGINCNVIGNIIKGEGKVICEGWIPW